MVFCFQAVFPAKDSFFLFNDGTAVIAPALFRC